VLPALGLNVAWLAPSAGWSRRGTQAAAVFHGDVLRKLLLQIAARDRAAGRQPGASLLSWWNETVGPAFLRRVGGGTGAWIRDVTKRLVKRENDRYEASEVLQEEGKAPQRGYKLGLLSTLLDTGRLLVQVAWDGLRAGELPLTAPFVQAGTPMETGDSLRQDRGLIDGAEITVLKRDLGVDVIFPLTSNMAASRTAVVLAERNPHRWPRHPTRRKQAIQKVSDLAGDWESCQVALNACVVREWNEKKQADDYFVFATTNLERGACGILRDDEVRSECEEDHRQTQGPDGELDEYLSRKLVEILYHVWPGSVWLYT
jgi:hypothetical protein